MGVRGAAATQERAGFGAQLIAWALPAPAPEGGRGGAPAGGRGGAAPAGL
jgi:hypothetical protein